jgi:hypothetical protein
MIDPELKDYLGQMESRLTLLIESVSQSFGREIHAGLSGINKLLEVQDRCMDRMETRLRSIEMQLEGIRGRVTGS